MASSDFGRYLNRTVLVQLDEHTIAGVLARESTTALTLQRAQLLAGDQVTDMEGEVVVDRFRVVWVQVA